MPNPNLHENKFKRALVSPFRNIIKLMSKKWYVSFQYQYITHHKLNLKNPVRYTEKLQYLRLFAYPKDPLVIQCAGRVGVRDYVKSRGFCDKIIPIYGIFDRFDDIDFNSLPNQFVMKCSHGCAFNYICRDKNNINIPALRNLFTQWLRTNYGKKTVEMHYSPIKPQIIIEEYLMEEGQPLPVEYKIHVFNGHAKYMYVVTGRGKDIRYNNYYIDWIPFDGAQFNGWKKTDYPLRKPDHWDDMIAMAEILAQPFPFVRVDLYNIRGKIYFSEMTFTPAKGTLIFDDDKADFEIGKWLDISSKINAK
ncbi:MAG TPA: ATP-grasp fold amidoligase family protein [Bacilli bacterium]|nr:ATP-grasp fold amidoligase family protein [Bacilli bacterium]